jgi:hypothetical protein
MHPVGERGPVPSIGSSAKVKWDKPPDRLNPSRMDRDFWAMLKAMIEVREAWHDAVDGGVWAPRSGFNGPGSGVAQSRPTEAAVDSPTRSQMRAAAKEATSLVGDALQHLEIALDVLHRAQARQDPEVLDRFLEKRGAALQPR